MFILQSGRLAGMKTISKLFEERREAGGGGWSVLSQALC
jgi:hypothetical protein